MLAAGVHAQSEYALQIENDKKIINIDRFGLPESASILEAISVLPELLARSSETILLNYDVKIDGFSLGAAYEGTLSQIRLEQVEKIEISESPIDSYKNNGEGGSINIVLKNLDDGLSGEASVAGYSSADFKPMVLLGYKKSGLTLRGIAEYEHYRPYRMISHTQGFDEGEIIPYSQIDTTNKKYNSETMRLLMTYLPNARDEFKLRFSEHFSWDSKDQTVFTDQGEIFRNTNKNFFGKTFNLDANTSFSHKFSSGNKFMIDATYSYSPKEEKTAVSTQRKVDSEDLNSSISGKVEYEHHFKTRNTENFSKLFVGANANLASLEKYDQLTFDSKALEDKNIHSVVHTWFISPYAKYDAKFGKWRLKAELEYQNFNYNVRGMGDEKFVTKRGDFTGKAMAGWQFNNNNHLQLILDRKLERPNGALLYPFYTYNPDNERFEHGNPELIPVTINELSINYITNLSKGPHEFVFNGKVSYTMVYDMLMPVKNTINPSGTVYYTFENNGANHIITGEIAALYKVGILSLSFTGNVYNNHQIEEHSVDDYTYYNLSLFPTLHFKKAWVASAKCTYHSRVTTSNAEIGSATTLFLYASKSWNNWAARLSLLLPLNGKSADISQTEGMTLSKTYYYVYPNVGLTVNYKF